MVITGIKQRLDILLILIEKLSDEINIHCKTWNIEWTWKYEMTNICIFCIPRLESVRNFYFWDHGWGIEQQCLKSLRVKYHFSHKNAIIILPCHVSTNFIIWKNTFWKIKLEFYSFELNLKYNRNFRTSF